MVGDPCPSDSDPLQIVRSSRLSHHLTMHARKEIPLPQTRLCTHRTHGHAGDGCASRRSASCETGL